MQLEVQANLPILLEQLRQRYYEYCGKLAQHLWLPTTPRLRIDCTLTGLLPLEKEEIVAKYKLKDE